jgi:hypothetical protein
MIDVKLYIGFILWVLASLSLRAQSHDCMIDVNCMKKILQEKHGGWMYVAHSPLCVTGVQELYYIRFFAFLPKYYFPLPFERARMGALLIYH